ncbi:MAG TPA: hypothetical protein VGD48_38540 [Kutzneria sp.]
MTAPDVHHFPIIDTHRDRGAELPAIGQLSCQNVSHRGESRVAPAIDTEGGHLNHILTRRIRLLLPQEHTDWLV